VRDSTEFVKAAQLSGRSDKEIFDSIFPKQVDQGLRKPTTWVWMMSRIRDGNRIKPPRNLIDLIIKAREVQLRAEDRNPREYSSAVPMIEPDAVRRAHRGLSEQRVQDTLLAEAADFAPIIEKFRDGKAEHDVAIDLQALLNLKSKVSYSHQSVSADDHNRANRAASHLVEAARRIAQPATGRGG